MIAPTGQQLRILKLIAAGCAIYDPVAPSRRYLLCLPTDVRPISYVWERTIDAMRDAGWIARNVRGRWILTEAGRGLTEVGTFVRSFVADVTTSKAVS